MVDSVNSRPAVTAPPAPTQQDIKPQAAPTQLAPAKAVVRNEAADKKPASGQEPRLIAGQRSGTAAKSVSLDAETQTVILKKTDTDTGQVLEQYPTEAQLGLRTYAREQTETKPEPFERVA